MKDLPNSHFLESHHNMHELKHEKYVEKWKKLIYQIRTEEGKRYIVIRPSLEGRITILKS